jgi:hypothetical protein
MSESAGRPEAAEDLLAATPGTAYFWGRVAGDGELTDDSVTVCAGDGTATDSRPRARASPTASARHTTCSTRRSQ